MCIQISLSHTNRSLRWRRKFLLILPILQDKFAFRRKWSPRGVGGERGLGGYHQVTSWLDVCPHLSRGSQLFPFFFQQEICHLSADFHALPFIFGPFSLHALKQKWIKAIEKLIILKLSSLQAVIQWWKIRYATVNCKVERPICGAAALLYNGTEHCDSSLFNKVPLKRTTSEDRHKGCTFRSCAPGFDISFWRNNALWLSESS